MGISVLESSRVLRIVVVSGINFVIVGGFGDFRGGFCEVGVVVKGYLRGFKVVIIY